MKRRIDVTGYVQRRFNEISLALVLAVAAFFRLWELLSLPPGLGQAEAKLAVRALAFSQQPSFSLLAEGRSLAESLFVAIQAVFIRLIGNTELGIRIFPALLGVGGVLLVYLWGSNWFNRRIGLVAALLMAVTPWIVTASRRGDIYSWLLFAIPLTLWLFTRAIQTGSSWRYGFAGVAAGLCLTDDLGGYILLVTLGLTVLLLGVRRREFLRYAGKRAWLAVAGLGIVLIVTAVGHLGRPTLIRQAVLPDVAIAQQTASRWATSATKTILMFNTRGDSNFSNNVGVLPLLNFFVGLMLVMGILVSVSRFHRARYAGLLLVTLVVLLPAALSPYAPDARAALAAAPLVLMLAAVGINYLLELWYGTFPVNSAARTLGTLPIALLLLITAYQGYKQYFVAWAGSPEVYQVYNEAAMSIARWSNRTSYEGQRLVAVDDYSRDVLDYLTHDKSEYSAINPSDIAQIPTDDQPKQIIVPSLNSVDAVKTLKERFPKARLSQHYSEHNDNNELFIVFEVLK